MTRYGSGYLREQYEARRTATVFLRWVGCAVVFGLACFLIGYALGAAAVR